MNRYLEELECMGVSLLIYKGEEVIHSSTGGGMKPLLEAIGGLGREMLRGSIVVDKVVGRAAALLILYMEASEVHAGVVSSTALEVLRSHALSFHYGQRVEAIRDRDGFIICPFERLVQDISDPEEAYNRIRAKISELDSGALPSSDSFM